MEQNTYDPVVGYLWVKSLHVVAVISWMAGLLYVFRLFVYHAMEEEKVVQERLQVMERRLIRAIMTPAMVLAVATGVTMLALQPALLAQPWMWVKLCCVAALIALHLCAMVWRTQLIASPRARSHKFYRVMNEVPTVLMIVIVIMVIRRP
jgi:putative membrane protein